MNMRLSIVLLTLVAAGGPAAAKEKTPAAKAFARGKQLLEERSYVAAIAAFEEAYRLKPHFFVQCSIARCYENMNRYVQAAERYRRCLSEGAARDKLGPRVQKSLSRVEAKIAWLNVKSPGGGGTILVDGKAQGEVPGKIAIDPGSHSVEVRREGAKPASTSVRLRAGETKTVTLVPEMPQPEAAAPSSRPVVAPVDRPPGRKGLHPAWFWTTAALTAALTTTFIVLGVQSFQLRADYEDDPTEQGYDTFRDRRRLTNIFIGLAGAAAATGTVLFFFTDFRGQEREPATTATLLGAGLRGTF
jgi:hypothetical protein